MPNNSDSIVNMENLNSALEPKSESYLPTKDFSLYEFQEMSFDLKFQIIVGDIMTAIENSGLVEEANTLIEPLGQMIIDGEPPEEIRRVAMDALARIDKNLYEFFTPSSSENVIAN